MTKRVEFLKMRRMCGGGTWKYFFQDPLYYFSGEKLKHWIPRRTDGAVIFDAVGVAIAWRGDWGERTPFLKRNRKPLVTPPRDPNIPPPPPAPV